MRSCHGKAKARLPACAGQGPPGRAHVIAPAWLLRAAPGTGHLPGDEGWQWPSWDISQISGRAHWGPRLGCWDLETGLVWHRWTDVTSSRKDQREDQRQCYLLYRFQAHTGKPASSKGCRSRRGFNLHIAPAKFGCPSLCWHGALGPVQRVSGNGVGRLARAEPWENETNSDCRFLAGKVLIHFSICEKLQCKQCHLAQSVTFLRAKQVPMETQCS